MKNINIIIKGRKFILSTNLNVLIYSVLDKACVKNYLKLYK